MFCKYGGADDHVSQVVMSFICYLVVATMTLQENKLYNNINTTVWHYSLLLKPRAH